MEALACSHPNSSLRTRSISILRLSRENLVKLWSVYVIANERASVVSRKWVAARDEAEARTMATKDSRSETGRVLLIKPHHSDSVSVTDQWSVADIKAIAEELS